MLLLSVFFAPPNLPKREEPKRATFLAFSFRQSASYMVYNCLAAVVITLDIKLIADS